MFLANTNRDHTRLTKVIDANQGRSSSEDFLEDGLGESSKYENQHEDDNDEEEEVEDEDEDEDDVDDEYKVTESDDEVEEPLEFDSEHEDEEEKRDADDVTGAPSWRESRRPDWWKSSILIFSSWRCDSDSISQWEIKAHSGEKSSTYLLVKRIITMDITMSTTQQIYLYEAKNVRQT